MKVKVMIKDKVIAETIHNEPNELDMSKKSEGWDDIEKEWFRQFVIKSK